MLSKAISSFSPFLVEKLQIRLKHKYELILVGDHAWTYTKYRNPLDTIYSILLQILSLCFIKKKTYIMNWRKLNE